MSEFISVAPKYLVLDSRTGDEAEDSEQRLWTMAISSVVQITTSPAVPRLGGLMRRERSFGWICLESPTKPNQLKYPGSLAIEYSVLVSPSK